MKSVMLVSFCLFLCSLANFGCSQSIAPTDNKNSPAQDGAALQAMDTTGPGDPNLSYELVIQNLDTYKGKRVRWFGRKMSSEDKGKPDGSGYIHSITFINNPNPETAQGFEQFRPFVVKYESKEMFGYSENGWIIGTILGTHTVGVTATSPSGSQTNAPKDVPLLGHPQFEPEKPRKK
jgi:hypothetical protein